MHYPIPRSLEEIAALSQQPVSEEVVAAAIAGVITICRAEGHSLAQVQEWVLAEDDLLDRKTRQWLSEAVAMAWSSVETLAVTTGREGDR
ncbi:hypothetical protein RHP47_12480 [Thermosynechococcus sp. QKsg1]|uniref:hypothetical protein n=1 Tax=unclassified Thermosynechococcus TaxID=2622553 RepID=UPI00122E613C|nr:MULTISPECIES: hypothetical protein [unclassified Thermosynechococcus]QEQ02112.1 hypothetical protein FFX45_12470 [Thermosynechococcus sp. CL-1]WJI24004.1 hypothetical protein MZ909_12510 [Thermosynechococcus sp. B0]WJI26518.1 hypothetical protein M0644_12545 [Thermosynechococcus sp. B1]WJI29044.1 hypothetical protein M0646_12550 [Thermosynechococcus sp. B3]WKT83635.1 hypothetical protein QYC28_12610 [Thermosynechococcus sp. HY596]